MERKMNKTIVKKKTMHRLKLIQSVKPEQKPIDAEPQKPRFDLTGIGLGLDGVNQPMVNAVQAYLNTDTKQACFTNWFIDGNTLYYRCTDNSLHVPTLIEHVIATKVNHDGKTLI